MRIGLQTWGSDGDIRPMIALAGGLRREGLETTIVASSIDDKDYSQLCRNLDVEYIKAPEKMGVDLPELGRRAEGKAADARLLKVIFEDGFFPFQEQMFDAAMELCRRCDVIVAHFATYPARAAAIKTGRPFAEVIYWPGFIATGDYPPVKMPDLGRRINRLEWRLLQLVLDMLMKKPVQQFWRQHGLPPFRHVVPDVWGSDLLSLIAASPLLWPAASDWPAHYRLCGFFNVPESSEPLEMPPDLREFLAAGPPPLYMTFGTPGQVSPDRVMELLTSAARLAGGRTIIQSVSAEYPPGTCEGDIYYIGRVPHSQVFPLCSGIVHHGGAGHTHSSLRAGLAAQVVAFSDEQASWARQLAKINAGLPPLNIRSITAESLAAAIKKLRSSPELAAGARQISRKMKDEDGVAAAVKLIRELAEREA